MNVGLDTSVVLRLLTGQPEAQARCALAEFQTLQRQGGTALVSDLVVSETYLALHYHYGVPKAEALAILARFLGDDGVATLGVTDTVLSLGQRATGNPGFVDRLIHAQYLPHAGEVLSFEKAAARLPGVRVLTGA